MRHPGSLCRSSARANNSLEVSKEFGPAFGTPGDQRLFAGKLSAFDPPVRAALRGLSLDGPLDPSLGRRWLGLTASLAFY
jgi:hypothetical protein